MLTDIRVGIITISDRAAAGEYQDLGGPALRTEAAKHGWTVAAEAIVPDDVPRIQEVIRSFGAQGCGLILTTGGTGIAPRDVTPEAIRALMRTELPGFGEAMRAGSLALTPNAILSRAAGGGGGALVGHRAARQTRRSGGMPGVRRGCGRARRQASPKAPDLVLIRVDAAANRR